jgi:hypothetical protein
MAPQDALYRSPTDVSGLRPAVRAGQVFHLKVVVNPHLSPGVNDLVISQRQPDVSPILVRVVQCAEAIVEGKRPPGRRSRVLLRAVFVGGFFGRAAAENLDLVAGFVGVFDESQAAELVDSVDPNLCS